MKRNELTKVCPSGRVCAYHAVGPGLIPSIMQGYESVLYCVTMKKINVIKSYDGEITGSSLCQ